MINVENKIDLFTFQLSGKIIEGVGKKSADLLLVTSYRRIIHYNKMK